MATSIISSDTSVEDRQATGERAGEHAPLSAQADWEPAAERPDPVEFLIEQNATREADLVPVRHGRMTAGPSLAPTPDPETPSPSPNTSAPTTPSITPSPTFPPATPTRTNATTTPSSKP